MNVALNRSVVFLISFQGFQPTELENPQFFFVAVLVILQYFRQDFV